jgi:hypothetical protein
MGVIRLFLRAWLDLSTVSVYNSACKALYSSVPIDVSPSPKPFAAGRFFYGLQFEADDSTTA